LSAAVRDSRLAARRGAALLARSEGHPQRQWTSADAALRLAPTDGPR
jgi:hypothetical protein